MQRGWGGDPLALGAQAGNAGAVNTESEYVGGGIWASVGLTSSCSPGERLM